MCVGGQWLILQASLFHQWLNMQRCAHSVWRPLVHSINSYPQRVRVLHYWIPLTRQTHNFPLSHLCMKVGFPAPIKVVPWDWLADDFLSNPRLLFKAEFIQLNSLQKKILNLAQFSWEILLNFVASKQMTYSTICLVDLSLHILTAPSDHHLISARPPGLSSHE